MATTDGSGVHTADHRGAPVRPAAAIFRPRTIRAKLARILMVSLAIVLGLLTVTVLDVIRGYRAAADTSASVSLALGIQDVIHELQRERGLTNGLLGGESRYRAEVAKQRGKADTAITALNGLIGDGQAPGAATVRTALDRLSSIAAVRGDVDASRADRDRTFTYYTEGITGLNHLNLGFDRESDPTVRRGIQALAALGDAKEATAQERGFLNGVFATGKFRPQEYIRFTEIRAGKQTAIEEFGRNATPEQRSKLDGALRSTAATEAAGYEGTAVAGASGPLPDKVDAPAWWAAMTTLVDDMRKVQQSVGDDIRGRASDLQGVATTTLIGFLLLAGLAVAGEVVLVIGATRSIIGPLASLAKEADEVASQRLPEAVAKMQTATDENPPPPPPVQAPARSTTEIRSMAEALNRVQDTAFALASEQAVLRRNTSESLANLGRRNQNLVRRQLSFISEFEKEELDPSTLANLFELDHLATRMRRNAESLLVLVGESSPRRWSAPLPITDVIRAALSEVEEYRRVVLRRMDEVLIAGAVVTEVAHLLAELIENGLAFSPPDLEVEIYGRQVGSQYLLAIIDHGVGMTTEALDQANARLRGEENFLVAPTRFLGHYVVGRLASRLSTKVELAVSPATGITARITMPAKMIVDPASPAATSPPVAEVIHTAGPVTVAAAQRTAVPAGRRPEFRQPTGPAALPPAPVTTASAPGGSMPPGPLPAEPPSANGSGPTNAGPERTRNGLVKRVSKNRPASPAAVPRHRADLGQPVEPRSPNEVRSMLSTFRNGHQRGSGGQAADTRGPHQGPATPHPGPTPEEDPRDR